MPWNWLAPAGSTAVEPLLRSWQLALNPSPIHLKRFPISLGKLGLPCPSLVRLSFPLACCSNRNG